MGGGGRAGRATIEKNVISEPKGLLFVMGEKDCHLFNCQGAALPISKNSSHGAEYPGDQALDNISITPAISVINDCDLKALNMFPGKQGGQGQQEKRLRV